MRSDVKEQKDDSSLLALGRYLSYVKAVQSAHSQKLLFSAAHSGFTLIELIVVITIIAFLAAVALPRFVDVQKDARASKAKAIFGSVRSAASLAKSRCELDIGTNVTGTYICNATGGHVNMDGTAVTMVNKYPTADVYGIQSAASINPNADELVVSSSGGSAGGATMSFDLVGSPDPANCRISYSAANVGAAPIVNLLTTGC